jgi:glutamyl-tRNA reductase
MNLLALGLNHTTAGLALRERVAFSGSRVREALSDLRGRMPAAVPESAIVSTCNRTELYCVVQEPAAARCALVDWLADGAALDPDELHAHVYALPQRDAVRHAFRVASGLDSMVLGEPQILGQMKEAARRAQEVGSLGTHLHQLFQRSFAVAKEVRSETRIGSATVSFAAAGVRIARRLFDGLEKARVLFVGAGPAIDAAAMHFAAQHPLEMVIATRTPQRAEGLARRFAAQTMHLSELPTQLARFDVVVSGTASTLPVIGLGMVERAMRARDSRPMLILDLAVPRDVESEAGGLDDVLLYTVDDLEEIVRSGLDSRRSAVEQAEAIIDCRVESFMRWMAERRAVPVLRTLEERAQFLCAAELQRARRLLARGDSPEAALQALAAGLSNKFLHAPRRLFACGALAPEEASRLLERWLPERAREAQTADY